VTAFTLKTGSEGLASPVPGNSGIALPVLVFWSSATRLFGTISPSMPLSARAIA
jgi:hypothetical protein